MARRKKYSGTGPEPYTAPFWPEAEELAMYYRQYKSASPATIESMLNSLRAYQKFLDLNCQLSGFFDETITKQTILAYKDLMEQQQLADNTLSTRLQAVKSFYAWAEAEMKIPLSPYPKLLSVRIRNAIATVVPTPKQIFQMRGQMRIPLQWAMVFEMLLSSGMRSAEFCQLRCCDILRDRFPKDTTTKMSSRFVGASALLRPDRMQIKSMKQRWVFFSKLAIRMLDQYLALYNVDPASPLPIWPFGKAKAYAAVQGIGDAIIPKAFTDYSINEEGIAIPRDAGFRDISAEEYPIHPEFREAIIKRQKAADKVPENTQKAVRKRNIQEVHLHPHSLRYAFTCFQYYLNYHGERQNLERVRAYLGHAGIQTSLLYLSQLDYVADDATISRLWLGKPHDWRFVSLETRRRGRPEGYIPPASSHGQQVRTGQKHRRRFL